MRAFVAGILLAGCGFSAVRDNDGGADLSVETDLSTVGDLAGADLANSPSSDLAATDLGGATCALPQLLVTVENLKNPSTGGGRVARMMLGDGSALPQACSTLSGQGLITPQPFSAAWIPGGRIAVITRDAFHLLDPQNDTILRSRNLSQSTYFPVDVFPLKDAMGKQYAAAAWANGGSAPLAIRVVELHGIEDGSFGPSWGLNAVDLPLGLAVHGMTTNPFDATHFFAVDGTGAAAWDVDPWSGSKTEYAPSTGAYLVTISSAVWSTLKRTAWLNRTSPTSVYYKNDDGVGPAPVSGPIACTGCTLEHVVPDPTTNTRFFGLCDGPTVSGKRVVRFTSTGTCETVLQGAGFGSESRLSRLAIAQ